MPWKCPPLHLPNWNNLWKWKEQMNAKEFAHELEKAASFIRQQQAEIEALKNIIERLTSDWTRGFRNYEYNSDEPEENKLRDDVFSILRKAQEK